MPTSAPGSRALRPRRAYRTRGFTLIELLVVIAIVAVSAALITLSIPDGDQARLEEEGARLTALLEMARAEARVAGSPVLWLPRGGAVDSQVQFRFTGLSKAQKMPTRWLNAGTSADVVGAASVVLGPDAILPPQRIVLRLAEHRLELVSDGLGPFAVATPPAAMP